MTRLCSIEGCGKKHRALGFCNAHWLKLRKRGDPLAPPIPGKRKTPALERFHASYKVNPEKGCWEWQGSLYKGYAKFNDDGVAHKAHRYSYEMHVGPIPDGLVLDHLCRNRRCVNPKHLEPVTDAVNILRGVSPPAMNAQKTHCQNGHLLSGPNVYNAPNGQRTCRECRRNYLREYMRRRRAKGRSDESHSSF